MSRWFRIYDELLDDPKAQRLPPELFKAWVNLLCVASRGGGSLPDVDDIAFALRVTRDITRDWIEALRERGLIDIDPDDGSLSPHNWGSRQFRSDADPTSAERQRKKRAKDSSRKISPVTRDITPTRDRTETETETEAETEKNSEADASLVDGRADDATGEVLEFNRAKSEKRDALALAGGWWNELAAPMGLPQIDAIVAGSTREKHAWARCRSAIEAEGSIAPMLDRLGVRIRGSPFLSGKKTDFAATFDWVMNATNFQKIMEGTYENRQAQRAR